MRFTDTKTETLNLRVSPTFKQILKQIADHEQRSMVNMLEVMLGDYYDRVSVVAHEQKSTSSANKRARTNRTAQTAAAV